MNKTKFILEGYLTFIQEREWNDPDDPGLINDLPLLQKVVRDLHGSGELAQKRQEHQPSMVNVYIKNSLGDYRGRANTLNSYRFKKAGIKDWDIAKKILQKAIDHEKHIDPARLIKKIITVQNVSKEPLGKETKRGGGTSDDGYADGADSSPQAMTTGGPMSGGGQ